MSAALWAGVLGSFLFIVVFTVDGWTRPGYSPLRHPVSALALGPRGWVQTSNFVVCGLAITVGAVALAGAVHVVLGVILAIFGVGLVASGVFAMDPMRGYPPGTPDSTPQETTTRHQLHDWAGTVVFGALPLAAVLAAFVLPDLGWRIYSALTGALLVAGFLVFGQAWEQDHPRAGLAQRATIVVGWVWLGLLFGYSIPGHR